MQRDNHRVSLRRYVPKGKGQRDARRVYEALGCYYDELPTHKKYLYWKYYYRGAFTTKQAEAIELRHGGGTLHFKCRLRTNNVPEDLQDTLNEIDALMSKIRPK